MSNTCRNDYGVGEDRDNNYIIGDMQVPPPVGQVDHDLEVIRQG